jgi:hypothetical protein
MPGLHLWLWQNDEWLLSTFLPPCCPDGSDTLKLAKTLESGRGWTEGQQTSAAKGSGTALTAALLPQVGIRISINTAAFYTFSGCSDGQLSNCQCLSGLQGCEHEKISLDAGAGQGGAVGELVFLSHH